MKYQDGNTAKSGDLVEIDGGATGIVKCSIDDHDFTPEYPEAEWVHLKRGILVDTSFGGLVHYQSNEETIRLLRRNSDFQS